MRTDACLRGSTPAPARTGTGTHRRAPARERADAGTHLDRSRVDPVHTMSRVVARWDVPGGGPLAVAC
ncbi:hypothetical protein CBZ_17740 [Cellulomonas biazotea]|uniref:Uncharacterized protein n=1 Tax=Cellulomonas biazotea TaxID=1709 RepID=A0A402DRI6_9CELL|nr:hypothetical protein CBZ_17740 [Cellulomonas biazotea]